MTTTKKTQKTPKIESAADLFAYAADIAARFDAGEIDDDRFDRLAIGVKHMAKINGDAVRDRDIYLKAKKAGVNPGSMPTVFRRRLRVVA